MMNGPISSFTEYELNINDTHMKDIIWITYPLHANCTLIIFAQWKKKSVLGAFRLLALDLWSLSGNQTPRWLLHTWTLSSQLLVSSLKNWNKIYGRRIFVNSGKSSAIICHCRILKLVTAHIPVIRRLTRATMLSETSFSCHISTTQSLHTVIHCYNFVCITYTLL